MIRVSWAKGGDLKDLSKFGKYADQRRFIERSIPKRACLVAELNGRIVGLAIFDTGSFFDKTFIWLLHTHTDFRRRGVASTLISRIESLCPNEKLFTSTNRSNRRMHSLMKRLGFRKVGMVRGLDPGDAEIFYMKKLASTKKLR